MGVNCGLEANGNGLNALFLDPNWMKNGRMDITRPSEFSFTPLLFLLFFFAKQPQASYFLSSFSETHSEESCQAKKKLTPTICQSSERGQENIRRISSYSQAAQKEYNDQNADLFE